MISSGSEKHLRFIPRQWPRLKKRWKLRPERNSLECEFEFLFWFGGSRGGSGGDFFEFVDVFF